MQIELARGDSCEKGFILKSGDTPSEDVFDEIYFTVKNSYTDKDYVLQKRLTEGGIVKDEAAGHYTLYILPEDTNQLDFKDYDCDFEFKKEGYKKTFYGKFRLTKEVTHQNNE